MVKLKIDKHEVEAEQGMKLIEIIDSTYMQLTNDRNAVERILPRLCNHEALEPYASCRLCLVEVETNGKSRLETSCDYVIKEGEELIIYTNSPKAMKARKMNMELLLAKVPFSERLKHLAFQMGAKKNKKFTERADSYPDCIECGICTRACEEIVGKAAITLEGRGTEKHLSTITGKVTEDCIGCGLCYHLCPTNAIKMTEKDGKRQIWNREFKMESCENCKDYFATEEMIKYKKELLKEAKLPEDFFTKCSKCYKPSENKDIEINSQYLVKVLKNICKDCTRCVEACPKGLLSQTEDFNQKGYAAVKWNPVPTGLKKEDMEKIGLDKLTCAGCQACYRTCPESAIDIYTKKGKVQIIK